MIFRGDVGTIRDTTRVWVSRFRCIGNGIRSPRHSRIAVQKIPPNPPASLYVRTRPVGETLVFPHRHSPTLWKGRGEHGARDVAASGDVHGWCHGAPILVHRETPAARSEPGWGAASGLALDQLSSACLPAPEFGADPARPPPPSELLPLSTLLPSSVHVRSSLSAWGLAFAKGDYASPFPNPLCVCF